MSGTAIKQFFLEHGEKISFSIVGVCCLAFLYSAATHEALAPTNEPDRLREVSERAQQNVANSKWDPKQAGTTSVDFVSRAHRDPVLATNYSPHSTINPPIFQPRVKRGQPQIFPVEEMLVSSGFGTFALLSGPATGPVAPALNFIGPTNAPSKPTKAASKAKPPPTRGQPKNPGATAGGAAVDRSIGGAPASDADLPTRIPGVAMPSGAKLEFERWAVVTGLVPVKKQIAELDRVLEGTTISTPGQQQTPMQGYAGCKIERAEVTSGADQNLRWEPIDLRNVELFEAKWAQEAPDIVAPEYLSRQFAMGLGPLVGVDWDGSVAHPKVPLATKEAAVGSNYFAQAQGMRGQGTAAGQSQGDERGGFGEFGPAPPGKDLEQRQNDCFLFRFFDFSVKPGTRYRYRVQVGFFNPNYMVSPRYLKDAESAKEQVLAAPWSEPTPVVTISAGTSRIVAGPVKVNRGEPTAIVVVSTVPPDHDFEVLTKREVQRGSVANFAEKKFEIVDPVSKVVSELEDVRFVTNDLVVDIHGGRTVSKEKNELEPGEILVLDSAGNLFVRDEVTDHDMVRTFDVQERQKETQKPSTEPVLQPPKQKPPVGRPKK